MLKQERAVRTRHSLVHSAAQAFQQHGYVQARLADISSRAGVSPGALHFHFENKSAVASTVQAEAAESLRRAVRAATRQPGMNALQKLTDASHALADTLRRDVVARAGFQLSCDEACKAEWDLCQEWHRYVQRLLEEAADENLLSEDVARHNVAASIVAATTGLEVLARNDAEWLAHETLTGLWELILPCLATGAALTVLEPGGTHPGRRDKATPGGRRPVHRAQLAANRTALSTRPVPAR
ncbi:TetR family transcriptional regulator (plasmid) [Streptomyces lunaelactis]|uniref:TetR family transcriptional regulator n=1 Tax=Streptomyces lunaelactis TaxID=1535768 RepID=A0A2R4TFQ4_9ACTN|nr:ScbR family autoregulator-binding transcription factor [Streptomyces lunaelactis]AVZ77950.1 TetR family transcriptional regulator [Streptomyces lunaelactis]NUK86120.1 TetR/AcrR family transcriptional regulator [Streptomyces lunaelactis]NUL01687.1 TetR/AcrR family transcriptional regulator [Streptomyces lunaelactis]